MSTGSALPSSWRIGRARAGLELRLHVRDVQQMVFSSAYPVVMLAIFGSVFAGEDVVGGIGYTQYFLAGIAATGVMLSSFQALGTRIAAERADGELARLQALACPALAYFVGKAAQVLVTTGVQLALLLVLARVVFGLDLPSDVGHWVTFGWVALLGSLAGTVLGVAVSVLPRDARSADSVIAPVALVLQFFSGVFFVYSALPTWMQQVAAFFPLRWLTLGMRSALLPDRAAAAEVGGGWQHASTAVVLGAWVVVGLTLCVWRFRWRR